ncbi:MAG: Com family DNA-binding transcriptional regulator [Prevotellaceae bacterium]|jgi:phage FluMu protein Com|nr:Com family DNA-binding transcriptional regulator [Prevotellaceae bacterium]
MDSNVLKLIQLKCANCNSTLSRADKFETQIKCPYCGTVNEVTGTMHQDVAAPERIILFKTQENDFDTGICNFFVDQDYAVNDIFEKVQLENVTPIYLPMYLYEGRYDATYSCSVGQKETQLRVGSDFSGNKTVKEKTVTKWTPYNGTARDNYAFLSLAFEGKEITPELAEWTRSFPYEPVYGQKFDINLLSGKGFQILPHNLDREATWHKWGVSTLEYLSEQLAYSQIPGGQQIRDFRSNCSYDPKHDGRLFLVPFWFVYYYYDNKQFFVLMDGLGKNIHGSTPIDEKRVKDVRNLEKLGKWGLWIAIILGIVLMSVHFLTALIAFVVIWLGLKFFTRWKVGSIIKTARNIRTEAYNKLSH